LSRIAAHAYAVSVPQPDQKGIDMANTHTADTRTIWYADLIGSRQG
jgi:hypothetical protein